MLKTVRISMPTKYNVLTRRIAKTCNVNITKHKMCTQSKFRKGQIFTNFTKP